MPYITKDRREILNPSLNELIEKLVAKELQTLGAGSHLPYGVRAGDLNYVFSKIAIAYIENMGYQQINDVIGALECAKLELYRRYVGAYEDSKMNENGDIYI